MARPKGFKVSWETKQKAKVTREKNKEATYVLETVPYEIQPLIISGKEETGFDFWTSIRNTLRTINQFDLCKQIEREVIKKDIWDKANLIKNVLSTYFTLTTISVMPSKKIRKPMNLSDEERKRRSDRAKARFTKKEEVL
jgi:hypothetical protein